MFDLGKYTVIVKDINRILIRNVETGVTKMVYNLEQVGEFIRNDSQGKDYNPKIKIDPEL